MRQILTILRTSKSAIIRTHRIVIIRENKTLHVFICNKVTSSPTSSHPSNFSPFSPPPPPHFFISFSSSSSRYTFMCPPTMLKFEAHAFCDKLRQYINTNEKDQVTCLISFLCLWFGCLYQHRFLLHQPSIK